MYDVRQPQPNWTNEELAGFNIEVQEVTEEEFFGTDLSNIIRSSAEPDAPIVDILGRMDQIMRTTMYEEKYIDNMAADLLLILGYETGDSNVRTREKLWLSMSRELVAIKTDVCILDANSDIVLIVQNGTLSRETPSDPEAQLIAASIAAFQLNNNRPRPERLQATLAVDTVPGIVMNGAVPTFYKSKVTKTLDMSVQMGEFPDRKSIVLKYCPDKATFDISRNGRTSAEDRRKRILVAYRAFREFIMQTTVRGVNPADVMIA